MNIVRREFLRWALAGMLSGFLRLPDPTELVPDLRTTTTQLTFMTRDMKRLSFTIREAEGVLKRSGTTFSSDDLGASYTLDVEGREYTGARLIGAETYYD